MDWRKQAEAFYREASRHGLGCHRQVLAFLREGTPPAVATGSGRDSLVLPQLCAHSGAGSHPQAYPRYWGVACSGGADSLALLLWLYGAFESGTFESVALSGGGAEPEFAGTAAQPVGLPLVLHFDHGLRGAASRGDAAFVAEVADALGWALYSRCAAAEPACGELLSRGELSSGCASASAGVNRQAATSPGEETLRQWRQEFFESSGCHRIFQGHQRGDVAETLLMRVAAGSGLDGLCAPRPVSVRGEGKPVFLRPLLDWDKAQIIALLRGLGIRWREDESNARGDYFRNRVRLDVLPALQTAAGARDVTAAAALSRSRLEEDAQALDTWLDQVWPSLCHRVAADLVETVGCAEAADLALCWRQVATLPRAMQRRVLWRFLLRHGLGSVFSAAAVDSMLDAFGQAVLLPQDACSNAAPVRLSAGGSGFLSLAPATGLLQLLPASALGLPTFRSVSRPVVGEITASATSSAGLAGGFAGYPNVIAAVEEPIPLTSGSVIYLPGGGGSVAMEIVSLDETLRSAIRSGTVPCTQTVYLAADALGGVRTVPSAFAPVCTPAAGLSAQATEQLRVGGQPQQQQLRAAGQEGKATLQPATPQPATFDSENCQPGMLRSEVLFAEGGWPVVRYWQPGDCYHFLGAPGKRKLQDVFTDKKVPRAQRYCRPLVIDPQSGELLWVAGLPPAHACAVQAGTKTALRLTYIPSRKTVSPYLI